MTLAEALKAAFSRATKTGDREYMVRGVKGELPFRLTFSYAGKTENRSVQVQEGIETRSAEDIALVAGEIGKTEDVVVTGTASSTSEDWYGTEMSPACLEGMAGQFSMGVGVYPSHGGGMFGPGLEWDDELGRTTAAELKRAAVVNPADATEPGFMLACTMTLDGALTKTQELVRRLGKGQCIGLSIGGWFNEVRFIMDEESEECERIIVEDVELDHLAIVRNPANPDCSDLALLHSAGAAWAAERKAPEVVDPAIAPEVEPEEEPEVEGEPCGGDVEAEMAAPADDNPTGVSTSQVLDVSSPNNENRDVADVAVPEQEKPMLPEELELIRSLQAKVAELEARSTPAVPPVETSEARATRLEGELARSKQVISNLTSQPQRVGRGLGMVSATGQVSEVDAMINRAKGTGKHEALVGVVERSKKILTVSFRARDEAARTKLEEACNEAPDFLRDVCEAAHADGTLSEWFSTARNETLVG